MAINFPMCKYQALSFDDQYGYIIYCSQCQYLQFAFGCVLINFQRGEFCDFKKLIDELYEDYSEMPESPSKVISIPTPCEGLALFLSISELRVLHRIADEADSQLKTLELIHLFARVEG